ncbi:adenosine receptor A3-like [Asterias rubens]|uniref:adenosine receptor A3-like n=1 Tax=Asterias rubens TaxID=7604 RepID=UPI0014558B39|nr:adenosine receptor A3-like [Asterias rubens]
MSSNTTLDTTPHNEPPVWFDTLRASLLFVSVFLIITGNVLCIFVVRRSTKMRKVSRIFILSLAVADLCGGVFSGVPLLATEATAHWIPDIILGIFCKVSCIASIVFNGASFLSLLTVTLDCYVAVEKPLRYPSLLTARRAYAITLFIWLVMSCIAILYTVGFGAVSHLKKEWHWCVLDVNFLRSYSYIMLLVAYCGMTIVVPLVLSMALYGRIRVIIRRHNVTHLARAAQTGYSAHHQQRPEGAKSLTTFLIVCCGGAMSSLPLVIIMSYSHWTGNYSMYTISTAMVLHTCNNLLNVLVHVRRNKEFRTTASRLRCRCRNRQDGPRGTVPNSFLLTSTSDPVAKENSERIITCKARR